MKQTTLRHIFTEEIPEDLNDGVLYVSVSSRVVLHKCCCGCGEEVVTPLGKTESKLLYDGVSISLYPSIGNHDYPCRSHYWIERNSVRWSTPMTREEIEAGRAYDRILKGREAVDSELRDRVIAADDANYAAWVRRMLRGS